MRETEPMTDCFVQQHPAPAWAEHDRHFACRGRDAFKVDQRLRQRLVDRAVPGLEVEQAIVEVAAANAEAAGLATVTLFDDDRNVEAHQRPDVRRDEAVGADNLDHRPVTRQADADLRHTGVAGAGGGVDGLTEFHLLREGNEGQRIVGSIHRPVGTRRRCGVWAPRGIK